MTNLKLDMPLDQCPVWQRIRRDPFIAPVKVADSFPCMLDGLRRYGVPVGFRPIPLMVMAKRRKRGK